jgi:hypothetical protein
MGETSGSKGPERVYLHGMDDYDFESLCMDILARLGHGEGYHTPRGSDEGKDLIFTKRGRMVFVECRHRPNSAISRPMVQVLHSASQTAGAASSIYITTGRYSEPAMQYAKKVDPPMRLIDGSELADMAIQTDKTLDWGPRPTDEDIYSFIPMDRVAWNFLEAEMDKINQKFWPWDAQEDVRSHPWLLPFYRLDYSIPRDGGRKKRGRKKTYVLVNGSVRSIPYDHATYETNVKRGPEVDACFGSPVHKLGIWNPVVARMSSHLAFTLPYDDVRVFAVREGHRIAAEKGLSNDQVLLKDIHRIMIPWYEMERTTPSGRTTVAILLGKKPFLLSINKYR